MGMAEREDGGIEVMETWEVLIMEREEGFGTWKQRRKRERTSSNGTDKKLNWEALA